MSQNKLRMMIFGLWTGFMLLNILSALLGPSLRHGGAVGREQIPLVGIIGIFVPPLSCLGGFWFPERDKPQSSKKHLGRERCIVALVLTITYLIVVTLLLCWPIYIADYPATLELPQGMGLSEQMADAMKIATMLSPLPLAPIHYLTSARRPEA
jgi:hypothetical protein